MWRPSFRTVAAGFQFAPSFQVQPRSTKSDNAELCTVGIGCHKILSVICQ